MRSDYALTANTVHARQNSIFLLSKSNKVYTVTRVRTKTDTMDGALKNELKRAVARELGQAPEVRKIVVFGSFLESDVPNDMDLAVFQDSAENYLPLALKYRRMTRGVSTRIPMDIIPLRPGASGTFLDEIEKGEVIYER